MVLVWKLVMAPSMVEFAFKARVPKVEFPPSMDRVPPFNATLSALKFPAVAYLKVPPALTTTFELAGRKLVTLPARMPPETVVVPV